MSVSGNTVRLFVGVIATLFNIAAGAGTPAAAGIGPIGFEVSIQSAQEEKDRQSNDKGNNQILHGSAP